MNTPCKHTQIYSAVIFTLSPHLHTNEANAVYVSGGIVHPIAFDGAFSSSHSSVAVRTTKKEERSTKISFEAFEGRNSREVLDFNLFLSPAEVWKRAPESQGFNRVREGYFEVLETPILVVCDERPDFVINKVKGLSGDITSMVIPAGSLKDPQVLIVDDDNVASFILLQALTASIPQTENPMMEENGCTIFIPKGGKKSPKKW